MKRTLLIIVGIVIIAIALISYWPKQTEYFDGCSLVESEEDFNSFTDSRFMSWLRDVFELEYPHIPDMYQEIPLPESEIQGVKKILASCDLMQEGNEVGEATFTPMLEFVVGAEGQPYILSMQHREPILKADGPESCRFELIPVQKGRDGYWHSVSVKKTRHFVSDRLYRDLEDYIKSLPVNPDGLKEAYDLQKEVHQKMRDELKSKDSKMFY